ncbi:hypothetical protein VTN31DRAFT_578 [Thermomyces dupontii]|uniref:uncharacterized protein n=1 Tax=Talaromyces thermophilus TaxID=28565 RepID=UPI0037437919
MKFSAGIIFLSGISVATPLTKERQIANFGRSLARVSYQHRSNPPFVARNVWGPLELNNTRATVQYSTNWAGAVLIGSGYTSVTGVFTVPVPSLPQGSDTSNTQYCASAWVGVDGDTCQTAILQTGVDFCIQNNRSSYIAWYEWYPDYAYDFDEVSISAGDKIRVTVMATSNSTGVATVENLTNGDYGLHEFTKQSDQLCQTNAEWIVEDFQVGSELVPFADFGTITFTNATAVRNGIMVDTTGAQILDIKRKNILYTSYSASGNTVTIAYVAK